MLEQLVYLACTNARTLHSFGAFCLQSEDILYNGMLVKSSGHCPFGHRRCAAAMSVLCLETANNG